MKTVKPFYYDDFICIADKCPYTCCREWDISVDNKTALKWREMPVPGEKNLLSTSIKYGKSDKTLKFDSDNKCHLLDECGLCKVVKEYGEEHIPETCHVFPREVYLFSGRSERALSPACPYVLDLLWKNQNYRLVHEGNSPENDDETDISESPQERAAFMVRDWFIQLMDERNDKSAKMLRVFFCILRDMRDVSKNDEALFTPQFVETYIQATNIKEVFSALASENESDKVIADRFKENNELYLDLVNRYQRQRKYTDFLKMTVPAGENFCNNNYMDVDREIKAWNEICHKYEKYLRLYVWEEIGSNLISECNIESMLIKVQWIILEYIAANQALYLRRQNDRELSYEEIRETVAIMSRITGYNENEIRQFLNTEFEALIWPLDYAFLVV